MLEHHAHGTLTQFGGTFAGLHTGSIFSRVGASTKPGAIQRDGDVLVVTKLDRLARSTFDLLAILKRLESKQVKLHVLDQQIDTSTATGMFFTTVLAAVAAFENELRKERQADGIALAKKRGVQLGRKKSLTQKQVAELRQRRHEGIKIVELMKDFGISKASVYRALETTED